MTDTQNNFIKKVADVDEAQKTVDALRQIQHQAAKNFSYLLKNYDTFAAFMLGFGPFYITMRHIYRNYNASNASQNTSSVFGHECTVLTGNKESSNHIHSVNEVGENKQQTQAFQEPNTSSKYGYKSTLQQIQHRVTETFRFLFNNYNAFAFIPGFGQIFITMRHIYRKHNVSNTSQNTSSVLRCKGTVLTDNKESSDNTHSDNEIGNNEQQTQAFQAPTINRV